MNSLPTTIAQWQLTVCWLSVRASKFIWNVNDDLQRITDSLYLPGFLQGRAYCIAHAKPAASRVRDGRADKKRTMICNGSPIVFICPLSAISRIASLTKNRQLAVFETRGLNRPNG
jgi:hypothetical protein